MCASFPRQAYGYILLMITIFLLLTDEVARAASKDAKKAADKAAADKKIADKIKEVAGSAEFLRSLPKYFARFGGADPVNHRVTLLIEGESLVKVWPVTPDAEIKCAGWWGRLEQLAVGDRVWVWFKNDRSKHAVAVAMLADELSEQDIPPARKPGPSRPPKPKCTAARPRPSSTISRSVRKFTCRAMTTVLA